MLSNRKNRRVELGAGTGIIGSLFDDKGYGFIINHNQELDDLFFHFSEYPQPQNIQSGTEVSFECVQNTSTGKYKAQNIRILKKANSNNAATASYNGIAHRGHRGQQIHHHNNHNNHNRRNKDIDNNQNNNQNQNNNKDTENKDNNKNNYNENNQNNQNNQNIDGDRPRLGCFKLVKKDVTDRPMYIPVFPLKGFWKSRKQFV